MKMKPINDDETTGTAIFEPVASIRKAGKTIPVTVVRQTGASALVQFMDNGLLNRRTVPATQVINGRVAEQVLRAGIPYGYPWEDVNLHFDMRTFVNELHQIDVWTAEDLLKSPQKLSSALRAALAESLSSVLEIARNEHKGEMKHG